MKFFVLIFLTTLSFKSFGYANFIGHGYTSCLNCHFNPFGGGQLNDYGRVVSGTGISSRSLYPDSMTEEKIAHISGFLFNKPKQNWLRLQANYRGFELTQNPGGNSTKSWLTMQQDVRMTLKFGENDKFIMSGDYGKTPYPLKGSPEEKYDTYRSRSHYLGYRFSPKFGLYAGLMDKVFGIRLLEHNAYSRIATQTTQNDQVHGLTGHFLNDKWESGLQAFVGNLTQDDDLRMKGVTGSLERTIFDFHRVGISYQNAKNEYLTLSSYAVFGKFNFKEGSAILTEIGQSTQTTKNQSDDRTARYGILQTYLRPWRGFYVFNNIEYLKNDTKLDNYSVRWGPGIQYFPLQRLELRADLYNTRNFSSENAIPDSWMLITQLHVWL